MSKVKKISIKGEYVAGEKSYQHKVAVYPVEHHYEDNGFPLQIKYSCPICEGFGAIHSFPKRSENCPICGIKLTWDADE